MRVILTSIVLGVLAGIPATHAAGWSQLAPGLATRSLEAKTPTPVGDATILVVRIDPALWQLDLIVPDSTGETVGRTAREWASARDLAVVINAGMFAADYRTHVGYMESRGHVHAAGVNHYQSVAAFDPLKPGERPPFRIFDLDEPNVSVKAIRKDYASVVQNLRLIKRPGENRWSKQDKAWSEAALGEDEESRILFVFSRSPYSMHDLNRELLSADVGLVALQHLEGGPEAQLYIHVGDYELEAFGSYETDFREDDGNGFAWPIPNVLGVRRRAESR